MSKSLFSNKSSSSCDTSDSECKSKKKKNLYSNPKSQSEIYNLTPLESIKAQRLKTIDPELLQNVTTGVTVTTPIVNGSLNVAPIGGQVIFSIITVAPRGHTEWHVHNGQVTFTTLTGKITHYLLQPNGTVRQYTRYPGEPFTVIFGASHFYINELSEASTISGLQIVGTTGRIPRPIPDAIAKGDVYRVLRIKAKVKKNTKCV